MLKLAGTLSVASHGGGNAYLVPLTRNPHLPLALKGRMALIKEPLQSAEGFKAVLTRKADSNAASYDCDVFSLSSDFDYLDDGDIVRLDPSTGSIRCLYRKNSPHNTILLTEQCDHYCLMCSQPPKNIDDSWLLQEAFELISLMPVETSRLGFSGGEPTLHGERLIALLHHVKRYLPHTSIDMLSHGKAFKDLNFARQYASVQHPDLLIGIPIYSDDPIRHDYIVHCRGAFDDTIRGILNLKELNQKVEIRIVIHKQTIDRLVNICEFIARNLLFVDHVALMGLEITGFTRVNLEALWIDPFEYKDILSEAVSLLNSYGMASSVYNHQLCTVNSDVIGNYRKSISDWKVEYLDECVTCRKVGDCGGLFSSSKLYKHSKYIKAFS